jgi:anti-anti-sigma factor
MSATIDRLTNATAVVTLSGPLTLGTSLKVAGVSKMVIDLTSVDFIDSAGLGMLVFTYGTLSEKHGSLRLCGVSPRVLHLLQLTKTDGFLAVDASREDSLTALQP